MIIFPAIDIKNGRCVRLKKGDMDTACVVADDPLTTAKKFKEDGALWLHTVDLDGAVLGHPVNKDIFIALAKESGLNIELGGGIRTMDDIDMYLGSGIDRVILGSAVLSNKALAVSAVKKYGGRIAVGIDAKDGYVHTDGWVSTSKVGYIELAHMMEDIGVQTIIYTDIDRDGMLSGPSFDQLSKLDSEVSCDITASGGVTTLEDVKRLRDAGLYGAICGKAVYNGDLDLKKAVQLCFDPHSFFEKSELVPAVITDAENGEVLMLAYMNEESFKKTLDTGYTWFYSRSRQTLWNKGETSGHVQKVVSIAGDCDSDTLMIRVIQTGAACHTGHRSCFFNKIL